MNTNMKNQGSTYREVTAEDTVIVERAENSVCCCKAIDAEVTLADIQRISRYLNLSAKKFYDKFCQPICDEKSKAVTAVTLGATGKMGACVFCREGKCTLGDVKPTSCLLHPLVREFIPISDCAWRVVYAKEKGVPANNGKPYLVGDLLEKSGALSSEIAFGHTRLAYYEAAKHYKVIYAMTHKPAKNDFLADAVRHLLTDFDETLSLEENAEKNRSRYRQKVWRVTEPLLHKAALKHFGISGGIEVIMR